MLAKQVILQAIEKLPDSVPYEKLIKTIDELQFIENTRQGLRDVEARQTHAAEDVFTELNLQ